MALSALRPEEEGGLFWAAVSGGGGGARCSCLHNEGHCCCGAWHALPVPGVTALRRCALRKCPPTSYVSQESGPIYRLAAGPQNFVIISEPEAAQHVLKKYGTLYAKGLVRELSVFLFGVGFAVAEDEEWKVRRRAVQPGLHKRYISTMVDKVVCPCVVTTHGTAWYGSLALPLPLALALPVSPYHTTAWHTM